MPEVMDPVCGMLVDTEKATEKFVHGDHVHYFCSAECRRIFEEEPARYEPASVDALGRTSIPLECHEPPYTTTGGMTSPKFGSAGSGGAEYELLPERHHCHPEDERRKP